jgi:hypothetical protein
MHTALTAAAKKKAMKRPRREPATVAPLRAGDGSRVVRGAGARVDVAVTEE